MGDTVCDDEVQRGRQELDDMGPWDSILRAMMKHWRIFE